MKNHDVTTVKIAGGDRMSLQIDGLGFRVLGFWCWAEENGWRRERELYLCGLSFYD